MTRPANRDEARAQTILQGVLDQLTQAIWDVDLDKLRRNTTNPHWMITGDRKIELTHGAELDHMVADFSNSIRAMGVTYFVRSVTEARFDGPDVIKGRYRSWFLRGTEDVYPSYFADMTLERCDEGFLMREARNTLAPQQWPILKTRSDGSPFETH